jgi:hypothetical protein
MAAERLVRPLPRAIRSVMQLGHGQASGVLAGGTLSGTAVWQAFAVLVPLCLLVLAWATRVFRTAVA